MGANLRLYIYTWQPVYAVMVATKAITSKAPPIVRQDICHVTSGLAAYTVGKKKQISH